MEMQVDIIEAIHLPILFDWWKIRGLGTMDSELLPPVGYVASDREGPAAAAWLYQPVGCKLAILDWLVTRPYLRPSTARKAARLVFETLAIRARFDGATRLFASVERHGMEIEAQEVGFTIVSHGNTHLVKSL